MGYVSNALWGLVGEEVSRIYRSKFFFSLLRQEVAYFDTATTGALATMLNTNVEHLRSGLGTQVAMVRKAFLKLFFI
jgi:ATP-binding cassette subfamily B (MDR/TAP) protein 1